MSTVMGLIFPSIIGIYILEKLLNELKFNIKDYIYYGVILTLLSNCLSLIISRILFNLNGSIEVFLNYPIFFVKYVFVSLIFNFIIAVGITIVKKNIDISIEVKKK